MYVRSVNVPVDATQLSKLLDNAQERANNKVALQAPEKNKKIVFIGDNHSQPIEIRPQANSEFPTTQPKELYIKGTAGDKLTVIIF